MPEPDIPWARSGGVVGYSVSADIDIEAKMRGRFRSVTGIDAAGFDVGGHCKAVKPTPSHVDGRYDAFGRHAAIGYLSRRRPRTSARNHASRRCSNCPHVPPPFRQRRQKPPRTEAYPTRRPNRPFPACRATGRMSDADATDYVEIGISRCNLLRTNPCPM